MHALCHEMLQSLMCCSSRGLKHFLVNFPTLMLASTSIKDAELMRQIQCRVVHVTGHPLRAHMHGVRRCRLSVVCHSCRSILQIPV